MRVPGLWARPNDNSIGLFLFGMPLVSGGSWDDCAMARTLKENVRFVTTVEQNVRWSIWECKWPYLTDGDNT